MYQDIKELYQEVFSEDGSVKNCGKHKCIDLILALQKRFPYSYFGSVNTGLMNIEEVQRSMAELLAEGAETT